MHAMGGEIDIRHFGGLRHRLPITHWTFLFGCLAIAGVVPFAGFWSKDAILLAIQQRAAGGTGMDLYQALWASTLFGVVLIDFYMFRTFFMTFYGEEQIPPSAGHHAHESPGTMTVPLMVLAFGSLTVGAYFEWRHGLSHFLAATPSLAFLQQRDATHAAAQTAEPMHIAILSTALAAIGITAVTILYLGRRRGVERLTRLMNVFGLYSLSYKKFFIDPIYATLIVRPWLGIAHSAAWIDHHIVDGLVDLFGRLPKLVGEALRPTQNGLIPFYALAMTLGLLLLIGALLI
jgi:NADH-quinone oxidoreductase subunit L